MPCQLPADCLNEIFEYLEEDKIALCSCLLANRLCCQVAIRILWRSILISHRPGIINTLIACLPDESKDLLYNNDIVISTPICKPPMFNYAAFVKELSISSIELMIKTVLQNQPNEYKNFVVLQEIMKMFMIQISSLNILDYTYFETFPGIPFTYFPGAINCLTDLLELRCDSNSTSEFFYHLMQICFNIKSLDIYFEHIISNGLTGLISSQNNLKHLKLIQSLESVGWAEIIPSLTKHSMTLTKLDLVSFREDVSILFIALFSNLQELRIAFYEENYFKDFILLQHAIFPKLRILTIPYQCPEPEHLMKFLENNGQNLKEFRIGVNHNSLILSIARFCPNIKKLGILYELETLKIIFNNCNYLESIEIWCGESFNLKEKEVFEIITEFSPSNFYELKLHNVDNKSTLFPEDLDSFLTSWKNRVSFNLLSLIIISGPAFLGGSQDIHEENLEIIEKYKNLGIIKKFEVKEDE